MGQTIQEEKVSFAMVVLAELSEDYIDNKTDYLKIRNKVEEMVKE